MEKYECPNCGSGIAEKMAGPAHIKTPQVGDYGWCVGCGKFLEFQPDMTLKEVEKGVVPDSLRKMGEHAWIMDSWRV